MRVVLQRVNAARVSVDGAVRGEIGPGLLMLVGVGRGDTAARVEWCAQKAAAMRVFEDERGRMNRSLRDTGFAALAVPNFTLYGDCAHGHRPDFLAAAPPQTAQPLFERFVRALRDAGVDKTESGVFGAHMTIDMQADGPGTFWLVKEE